MIALLRIQKLIGKFMSDNTIFSEGSLLVRQGRLHLELLVRQIPNVGVHNSKYSLPVTA